jgi:hypothetical protein
MPQLPPGIPGAGVLPADLGGLLGRFPPGIIPGLGAQVPAVPGIDPQSPEARALGGYVPLTAEAAASLLSMINQARQRPGRALPGQAPDYGPGFKPADYFMTASPGGAPSASAFTSPKGFSVVQTPSGMTTVSTTVPRFAPVSTVPRLTAAEQEAIRADQTQIASMAASAAARGSPAAASLRAQTNAARQKNILSGIYLQDALNPEDNNYWQILTLAGDKIRDQRPELLQQWYALPPGDTQRGFSIGIGIRFARQVDPGYLGWLQGSMSRYPALVNGISRAMSL